MPCELYGIVTEMEWLSETDEKRKCDSNDAHYELYTPKAIFDKLCKIY